MINWLIRVIRCWSKHWISGLKAFIWYIRHTLQRSEHRCVLLILLFPNPSLEPRLSVPVTLKRRFGLSETRRGETGSKPACWPAKGGVPTLTESHRVVHLIPRSLSRTVCVCLCACFIQVKVCPHECFGTKTRSLTCNQIPGSIHKKNKRPCVMLLRENNQQPGGVMKPSYSQDPKPFFKKILDHIPQFSNKCSFFIHKRIMLS